MSAGGGTARRRRLAVVVSHPIQYHAPLYRLLAGSEVVDLEVLFLSRHGLEGSYDAGFDATIAYDTPLVAGFRHRFLPNRSPVPSPSTALGLVNPDLARVLTPRAYDAVLVHGYAHLSNWLAFATARGRRLPYLLRGESTLGHEHALASARRRVKRATVGRLVKGAAGCLAIGKANRAFYLAYGAPADRVFSAPYSVDNDAFAAAGREGRSARSSMLEGVGLDPALPVLLFAAKLQPWKRPFDVLDAAARMREQANVVFVGDGPLRADLSARIAGADRVRAVGFVNQAEIGRWYGAADVLVLPSEREPWGLAVNEAMAAGAVPVVSEAVGCAPDLVDATTGAVVPVGDIAALAAALDRVVATPAALEDRRRAARDRVAAYGLDTTAAGIEEAVVAATGHTWPAKR